MWLYTSPNSPPESGAPGTTPAQDDVEIATREGLSLWMHLPKPKRFIVPLHPGDSALVGERLRQARTHQRLRGVRRSRRARLSVARLRRRRTDQASGGEHKFSRTKATFEVRDSSNQTIAERSARQQPRRFLRSQNLADFGQIRPTSARIWPKVAEIGRN